jgi:hypothetical protein
LSDVRVSRVEEYLLVVAAGNAQAAGRGFRVFHPLLARL